MSKGQFIGGAWGARLGEAMSSIDPATGDVVWQGAAATLDDVAAAVEAARAAFHPWADLPREARVAKACSWVVM